MSSGIYAYWDNIKKYYVYVGKDSQIDSERNRNFYHILPSHYDKQQINKILQNNPERYEYRVIMKGNYNDWQLNQMEKLCIKSFKTFKYDYPERNVFNFTKGGDGANGLNRSLNNKINCSKSSSSTGFFRVSKYKKPDCIQGFMWSYSYYENKNRKFIRYINLIDLKQAVKKKGLHWEIIDENKANECLKFEKTKMNKRKSNKTGILRVYKDKSPTCKRSFTWAYVYYESGKQKKITRANLKDLEKIVKERNLPWEIIDEEKAKKSYAEN